MKSKWLVSLLGLSMIGYFTVSIAAEVPVVEASVENAQPAGDVNQPSQNNKVEPASDASSMTLVGVPVPDNTQQTGASGLLGHPSFPLSQRMVRMEQQLNNLINMNLPQQIAELQEQVAQLRGQLQVQAHDLKILNNQQTTFYKDLDDRIKQLQNLNSNDSGDNGSNKVDNNTATTNTSSIQLKDSTAYQTAFDLVTKHQYVRAKAAFQNYMNNYPNGDYVANAHYWLGEIYCKNKDKTKAEAEFTTIVTKYPKAHKVPDAKLKLAIIHSGQGKVKQAKQELQAIIKDHPKSTAAQLANIRLQQMGVKTQSSTAVKKQ
jgi:tol-pal system protein YbgF